MPFMIYAMTQCLASFFRHIKYILSVTFWCCLQIFKEGKISQICQPALHLLCSNHIWLHFSAEMIRQSSRHLTKWPLCNRMICLGKYHQSVYACLSYFNTAQIQEFTYHYKLWWHKLVGSMWSTPECNS